MSKQNLRDATYSVHQLVKNSQLQSYATRHDYERILTLCVTELYQKGIQMRSIKSIKKKHIIRLINNWQTEGLNNATIKNRLSAIRFALKELGKNDMLPKDNHSLGIGKRQLKPTHNRAITRLDLTHINDPYVAFSLRLQQQFGLRRQESIKFIVSHADKEHYIDIKGSWTKGNVPRKVPIITQEQRQLINEIHCFCKRGQALIPKDKSYKQQLNRYLSQIRRAGIKNPHGFRHAYAQQRYYELTNKLTQGKGWKAPINIGIIKKQMTEQQKTIDYQAREMIANELGHSRINITVNYLL